MNIGTELKQRRESLKITIKEVSHKLRVKEEDIIALEENSPHLMTKHIYLVGFAQSYCRLLKINDRIAKGYLKNINKNCNVTNSEHKLINLDSKTGHIPNREYLTNALIIFLLIYLILISFGQFQSQNMTITNVIVEQFDKIK